MSPNDDSNSLHPGLPALERHYRLPEYHFRLQDEHFGPPDAGLEVPGDRFTLRDAGLPSRDCDFNPPEGRLLLPDGGSLCTAFAFRQACGRWKQN